MIIIKSNPYLEKYCLISSDKEFSGFATDCNSILQWNWFWPLSLWEDTARAVLVFYGDLRTGRFLQCWGGLRAQCLCCSVFPIKFDGWGLFVPRSVSAGCTPVSNQAVCMCWIQWVSGMWVPEQGFYEILGESLERQAREGLSSACGIQGWIAKAGEGEWNPGGPCTSASYWVSLQTGWTLRRATWSLRENPGRFVQKSDSKLQSELKVASKCCLIFYRF